MIDITKNSVNDYIDTRHLKSVKDVMPDKQNARIRKIVFGFFILFIVILFLPWTQNIRAKGFVTALKPEDRPATIQSVISGRIERWYVQEGDYVETGDTILFISDIKDEYFDPKLVERTNTQIENKKNSVQAYRDKILALEQQLEAMRENRNLRRQQAEIKLQQARLKLESDSMNFKAAEINFEVATQQFERMKVLFKEGLRSLTEYESRKLQFQREQASLIALENIFLNAKNDLISAKMEISAIDNDFAEKIAKTESEIQSTGSLLYEAVGEIAKMENKLSNIEVRQKMYYITSPMNGYITKAIKAGIGENFKEGIELVSIMPANASLAVEMFIEPIDFPLITVGGKVRFIFDGWPAIVFSGWPQLSNGTFGGRVYAIDNFASQNGLYRVLVIPEEEIWPDALRVGSGAVGYALLKDVPVWYELWRQLNGFPPDFYLNYKTTEEKK